MKPNYILLHHSKTKDGSVVDWQAIRRYHKSWAHDGRIITREEAMQLKLKGEYVKRPWRDIGYHYGIEAINGTYEIVLGRFSTQSGAHCYQEGMNFKSLGICIIGDYDAKPMDTYLYNKVVSLCTALCVVHNIPPKNIKGHRDFASYKTCPGKKVDISRIREDVAKNLS